MFENVYELCVSAKEVILFVNTVPINEFNLWYSVSVTVFMPLLNGH